MEGVGGEEWGGGGVVLEGMVVEVVGRGMGVDERVVGSAMAQWWRC